MALRTGMTCRAVLLIALALTGVSCGGQPKREEPVAARSTRYEDLVALFKDWREFHKPKLVDGVPDYSAAAMQEQRRGLEAYKGRLAAIDPSGWLISQQVDYHLVLAEMNGLEFDHRVMRHWARNPCFYAVVHDSQSDVPLREGPIMYGAIELWMYKLPLSAERLAELRSRFQAIPKLLQQAKTNLTEDAKDLWFLGIRVKRQESETLAQFGQRAAEHHRELVPDVEAAKAAVDEFRAWLEAQYPSKSKPSGIGIDNYNWYLKNVQLVPYTWQEQLVMMQRELSRSWAYLKLQENRNRKLPKLEMVPSAEEYRRRYREAVGAFIRFLRDEEIFTVGDYYPPALEAREGRFVPPDRLRDFFTQVEYRDLLPMRAHGTHWFDLARMEREPHASPIRRVALLYNIWVSRAEGFAAGFEEMVMGAGYLDERPRTRELIYIMLANRAARAMGDLWMHSSDWTLDEAVKYATEWTPYGWLPESGNTVWVDERLYLEQPFYGNSYVIGKLQIDKLLAERAHQLGDKFTLRQFFDEFHAAGMIPVSMIRWQMTGLDDEVKKLW